MFTENVHINMCCVFQVLAFVDWNERIRQRQIQFKTQ